MSLADAVVAVQKIEGQYRSSKVDRELAAKLIGYSCLSGPANKALAALAQYGLVERAGKGEMRVTQRACAEAIADRLAALPLNKINMNIQADVVHLSATLNYRGLTMLEKRSPTSRR